MSLVVLVIRLGTEKSFISVFEKSVTRRKSFSLTAKLNPEAVLAARYPQITAKTALTRVQPSILSPTFQISSVAPEVLIKVVSLVI